MLANKLRLLLMFWIVRIPLMKCESSQIPINVICQHFCRLPWLNPCNKVGFQKKPMVMTSRSRFGIMSSNHQELSRFVSDTAFCLKKQLKSLCLGKIHNTLLLLNQSSLSVFPFCFGSMVQI
eukprot:PhF_6_TR24760/c0_g1_i2/m.33957